MNPRNPRQQVKAKTAGVAVAIHNLGRLEWSRYKTIFPQRSCHRSGSSSEADQINSHED